MDLAAITNGFPGGPIEKRLFDFFFQRYKIVNWWIKVGFIPMTRNAVNDPKVRMELGEGGAPEEVGNRMEMLVEDYAKCAGNLSMLGFNGYVLDLQPSTVDSYEIPPEEEAQIEHIIKNKTIDKAGGLFKCGIEIGNCRVIVEAD